MEYKNQTECLGWCDTTVCNNTECPRWQEMEDRELLRELYEKALGEELNY